MAEDGWERRLTGQADLDGEEPDRVVQAGCRTGSGPGAEAYWRAVGPRRRPIPGDGRSGPGDGRSGPGDGRSVDAATQQQAILAAGLDATIDGQVGETVGAEEGPGGY